MAILIKVPKKIMFLISITLPVGRVDWKGFLAKNTVTITRSMKQANKPKDNLICIYIVYSNKEK
jgi:hypothetical protein